MTAGSTATVRSGVIGRPVVPRPFGKRAGSSASKQMRCPVRGQSSAQAHPRVAKLTVAPDASRPLPCTHTRSWNARETCAIGSHRGP